MLYAYRMNLASLPDSFLKRTSGAKPKITDQELVDFLSDQKMTYRDAAQRFGYSESTISHRVQSIKRKAKDAEEKKDAPAA